MLFELAARPDSELAERLAQVIVDRARADEQPCGDLVVPSIRLITDFREDRLALESHRIQVTGCVPAHVSLSALGRRRGVRGEHDRHGRALDTDPTADVSGLAGNPR
jgi:hypothetical protein